MGKRWLHLSHIWRYFWNYLSATEYMGSSINGFWIASLMRMICLCLNSIIEADVCAARGCCQVLKCWCSCDVCSKWFYPSFYTDLQHAPLFQTHRTSLERACFCIFWEFKCAPWLRARHCIIGKPLAPEGIAAAEMWHKAPKCSGLNTLVGVTAEQAFNMQLLNSDLYKHTDTQITG